MDSPAYAPSTAHAETNSPLLHGPYGPFRNNSPLSSTIVIFLVCQAMLVIFSLILSQLSPTDLNTSIGADLAQITLVTGYGQSAIQLLLVVLMAMWINRSCKNGWLLDPPKMTTTPGYSVGYYFIPLLNIWKPFVTMKEIRNASYGRSDKLKSTLPLWWASWLAILIIHTAFQLIQINTSSTEWQITASKLSNIIAPATIVLDYATIALVVGISAAQKRRAAQWQL